MLSAKLTSRSPCSCPLFSEETDAEELTTKRFHDPSECFQPEVITLGGGGKVADHDLVYGCWQKCAWKLFILPFRMM